MVELSLTLTLYVEKERNLINFNQPLTTRDGAEVMIYFRHKDGKYPIHGAYKDENGTWEAVTWTKEGEFYVDGSDDLDLINRD